MELLLPGPRPLRGDDLLDLYEPPEPSLRAGMLTSLDGASSRDGGSRPLQAPGDTTVFAALRAVADLVLVGAGTARAEGYGPVRLSAAAVAWRARRGRRAEVPMAVVSRSLHIPLDAAWLSGPRPYVVTCAAAPADRRERLAERAEVLVCGDDDVDLPAVVAQLAGRGHRRLLCEGGPMLLGDLVRAGQLTEICATVSPLLTGASAGGSTGMVRGELPATVPLTLAHLLREQDTLLGRWLVATRPTT